MDVHPRFLSFIFPLAQPWNFRGTERECRKSERTVFIHKVPAIERKNVQERGQNLFRNMLAADMGVVNETTWHVVNNQFIQDYRKQSLVIVELAFRPRPRQPKLPSLTFVFKYRFLSSVLHEVVGNIKQYLLFNSYLFASSASFRAFHRYEMTSSFDFPAS